MPLLGGSTSATYQQGQFVTPTPVTGGTLIVTPPVGPTAVAATGTGTLDLAGTAAATVTVSVAGALSLGGTATATATAASSGALSFGGTASAAAPVAASGSLTLAGTCTAQAGTSAAGSLTLGGSSTAASTATAVGSLTLTGAASATVAAASSGSLTLGGSGTARATTTATGTLTLIGTAAATGAATQAAAAGAVSLAGSATARATAAASGVVVLSGAGGVTASTASGGSIALTGTVSAVDNGVPLPPEGAPLTSVRLALAAPTSTGTVRRPSGSVEWRPTKRRNVSGDVVLPAPFTVGLTDPPPVIDVAPTEAGWAWQVVERVQGGSPRSRYLTVPDSVSVINYADLVEVDPATLAPVTLSNAWWTQVTAYAQPLGDYATNTALTSGLAGKQDKATLGAAVVADATVKAALVPGSVYNSDGSLSVTKKLHVKLTADGTDIDDLFIETVS